MNDPHDPFEEYLKTFRPSPPPETLFQNAVARSGRLRRRTIWRTVAAAALIAVCLGVPVYQRARRPPAPAPVAPAASVASGSLNLAFCRGGVDALCMQLDLAASQFAQGPNDLSHD
jgi:hypothetical protein